MSCLNDVISDGSKWYRGHLDPPGLHSKFTISPARLHSNFTITPYDVQGAHRLSPSFGRSAGHLPVHYGHNQYGEPTWPISISPASLGTAPVGELSVLLWRWRAASR